MTILSLCIVFSLCFLTTCGAPMSMDMGAMQYLVQFGYMDPQVMENVSMMTDSMMKTSVTDFQMFVGLEPTGEMDEATKQMMTKPRCGMKDKHDFDESYHRTKRFTIFGGPWPKSSLTFTVDRYPRNQRLQRSAVERELAKALNTWSDVTKLNFQYVPNNRHADIRVSFVSGDHGDGVSFDGRGNSLAHAYAPTSGMVHFDDDEPWTIGEYTIENIFAVAVHEFGHSLGLGHSNVRGAVMYSIASPYSPDFKLHQDDIKGIQVLYGPGTQFPPDLCPSATFDAIFCYPSGDIYVLKGQYYWKVAVDGPLSDYPKLISTHWPGLPGNVDAAAAHPGGTVYFFKGNKTWAYYGRSLLKGYPKLISDVWKGIPSSVDAAMYCTHSSFFYFFKGDQYWRYDVNQRPSVFPRKYPQPLSIWGDVNGNLDDALCVGNSAYFFREGRYYRYNFITGQVDPGPRDQPYNHRATGPWLFRCQVNNIVGYHANNLTGVLNFAIRNTNTGFPVLATLSAAFLLLLKLSL